MGSGFLKKAKKGKKISPEHNAIIRTDDANSCLARWWSHFCFSIEDWVYLFFLGSIMALISLFTDWLVERLNEFHILTYSLMKAGWSGTTGSFVIWVSFTVILVTFSSILTHYLAPQAIGSGIPEMKTILRGVVLKEYLTFRTLLTKIIGLSLVLGSGLPFGKEGPFVHMSAIVATQLSRMVNGFKGVYENESRSCEMLAAGCAVGVAVTFSSPIGGVLFSIEVTSVFFAVRNYWRGFFAASCGATITRIVLPILKDPKLDLNAQFQTHFPPGKSFTLEELPFFAVLGFVCGLLGALFIFLHRTLVLFLRRNWLAKRIIQRYWIIWPVIISTTVAMLTFPHGLGQYMAGETKFSRTVSDFFMNCTWSATNDSTACPKYFIDNWNGLEHDTSVFISLFVFSFVFYFFSIICSTVPVPAGIFMPVFVLGSAFGRLAGELVYQLLNGEIIGASKSQAIYPGIYSVVGTAAFAGAVTHTVSVAVIVFEVTGQVLFLIPVLIAVIISNAVCSYFQPSFFDSVIRMKHLPYLPNIRNTSSIFHSITAKDIMVTQIFYVARDSKYIDIYSLLKEAPRIRGFPVVDSTENMVLLGSISRNILLEMIDDKIGDDRRQDEALRRINSATNLAKVRSEPDDFQSRRKFTIVPAQEEDGMKGPTMLGDDLRLEELRRKFEQASKKDNAVAHQTSLGSLFRKIAFRSMHKSSSASSLRCDLYGSDREAWEAEQLNAKVELDDLPIDPSPFHLAAHTSLFKTHSLFSLLGLNRAYVTQHGTLVGVVALKEVRSAIEAIQKGQLLPIEEKAASIRKQSMMVKDIYADDSLDYVDNLQGRLEVVPQSPIKEVHDDGFDLGEVVVQDQSFDSTERESVRKVIARRESMRPEGMTSTRRSSLSNTRRMSLQRGLRRLHEPLNESHRNNEPLKHISFADMNLSTVEEENPRRKIGTDVESDESSTKVSEK